MDMAVKSRSKIVVSRDLGRDVMPLLYARRDLEIVLWDKHETCDRQWFLDNVPGAVGIIVMLSEKITTEVLDLAGPSLRVISTVSVGYEHVDLAALGSRGIKFGYTPDVLTDSVADLSVMLALMAGRLGGQTIDLVNSGRWPQFTWSPFAFCGPQLSRTPSSPTRTIGFLGFGRISQATLARLIPFGVTHCIYTSSPSSASNPQTERDAALTTKHGLREVRRVDADELAKSSDVLFVLAPGGDKTRHLVDAEFLRKMKPTSVLVNTSRGTLIDSDALAVALKEGWIFGAGLDVVEGEPNIGADHSLVKEPRCVILPHIGSATFETRHDMAELAVRNVLAGIANEPMPASLDLTGKH